MRIRSPRIAPPLKGLLGSIASTPTSSPDPRTRPMSLSVGVDAVEADVAAVALQRGPDGVDGLEDAGVPVVGVSVGVGGHVLSARWIGPGSESNTPILPRLPGTGGTSFLLRWWAGRAGR